MKFLNKTFILFAILVVGILVFLVGQMVYQSKVIDQQNNYQITVSGQGKVYVKPDIAVVDLGVKKEGLTVAEVTKTTSEKMNAIIEAIKGLEVEEKDIKTIYYNLAPRYNWTEAQGQVLQGYTLTQNIQVKIRDFAKIGDILSKATLNGANLVNDLTFTIDDVDGLKAQARAEAIAKAKANAENLAKESGVKLGKLINVYENYNSYPYMYDTVKLGMGGASESAPVPVIQPGQQEINVTINLTYQVK